MCACVRVCVSRGVGTERGKTVCWLFELIVVVLINPLGVGQRWVTGCVCGGGGGGGGGSIRRFGGGYGDGGDGGGGGGGCGGDG